MTATSLPPGTPIRLTGTGVITKQGWVSILDAKGHLRTIIGEHHFGPLGVEPIDAPPRDDSRPLLDDDTYRALLDAYMCADPHPWSEAVDDRFRDLLNAEAHRRGLDGWVEAYHTLDRAGAAVAAGQAVPS